jgi:hypothetical protein
VNGRGVLRLDPQRLVEAMKSGGDEPDVIAMRPRGWTSARGSAPPGSLLYDALPGEPTSHPSLAWSLDIAGLEPF